MKYIDIFLLYSATLGPIGHIPFAPGTFGSLAGIGIYFFLFVFLPRLFLAPYSIYWHIYQIIALLFLIAFSVVSSHRTSILLSISDPSCVVIDEVCGMVVALFGLMEDYNYKIIIFAFILFRVFDILKPFPVGFFDKKIKGGIGIVMDDVAAGIMTNFLLNVLTWHHIF